MTANEHICLPNLMLNEHLTAETKLPVCKGQFTLAQLDSYSSEKCLIVSALFPLSVLGKQIIVIILHGFIICANIALCKYEAELCQRGLGTETRGTEIIYTRNERSTDTVLRQCPSCTHTHTRGFLKLIFSNRETNRGSSERCIMHFCLRHALCV